MKAIIININKKVEVFDRGNGQYFCPEMHCIYGDSELAVCPLFPHHGLEILLCVCT